MDGGRTFSGLCCFCLAAERSAVRCFFQSSKASSETISFLSRTVQFSSSAAKEEKGGRERPGYSMSPPSLSSSSLIPSPLSAKRTNAKAHKMAV